MELYHKIYISTQRPTRAQRGKRMKQCIKYYNKIINGNKVPRKAKKAALDKKISKAQIKRMLKDIHLLGNLKTIYDGFGLDNEPFCMECGCRLIRWGGNRVEYPELWEVGYCARCGHQVAKADNSPYHHEIYDYLWEASHNAE
jgi:hypothetical protein